MDKEKCGTIPRVSVERALCQRNLLALVSARERDLIYKCFGYRRGCGEEVRTHRGLLLVSTSSGPMSETTSILAELKLCKSLKVMLTSISRPPQRGLLPITLSCR